MCTQMFLKKLSNRKIVVDVLAVLFGIGAWVGVNGIYVQLPLLVQSAPEGWNLPVFMVMVVQFANLGPILYAIYNKYLAWGRDHYIIYGILGGGALSVYVLAFVHHKSSYIFGSEHSTYLLGLMFVSSFVGCTSSVLFMPYMRNYREIYLVSYLVGEGLSGFLPSIVALVQGVGGNAECRNVTSPDGSSKLEEYYPEPNFSSKTYFIILGSILFSSLLAFVSLNKFAVAKGERVKAAANFETVAMDMNAPASYMSDTNWSMSKQTYFYLLGMMAVVCMLGNAVLPGIQSYSCLPYNNIAYHLTINLASMALPLALCSGFFIQVPKIQVLSILMGVFLIFGSMIFYVALSSPTPPLQHSWLGKAFVVILWVCTSALIGFIKMCITTIFRRDPGKGLYYTGIATQLGSLVGAIISFVVVNETGWFRRYSPCLDVSH
ncbi:riboflavin transporter 2-like [Copidosoma floridanum]|uniref:riboflavin transporter 2-like n=1 Tax=Copidosoma floridanum TaxID=29053 RepID=UPI0006C9D7D3|nr:riboflavin transporter 2-like [Copidosoma floridanum]